jgi:hypothetical protein
VLEPTNFESAAAEECVRSKLVQHFGQVARYLSNPPTDFDKLRRVCDAVMVHLELAGLIAASVYEVAAARTRGFNALFVPPHVVEEWKTKLLAAWDECLKSREVDAAVVGQRRQTMAETFDRVKAMAQPQWEADWKRMRES